MKTQHKLTVAVTGGTGFLGGHVLDVLAHSDFHITALTRRPQKERQGIRWITGSLDDTKSLHALCEGADILINIAGLTKALNRNGFFAVNRDGTLRLFEAAARSGIQHVVHVSSLAARAPELSHYGASKAASEELLMQRNWPFGWSIIRPPAIYGPGDKEILKLLKATRFGVLPAPGSYKNRVSMIHAADLASAIACRAQGPATGRIEDIDDQTSGGYSIKEIAASLPLEGGKAPKVFSLPFWAMAPIAVTSDLVAQVTRTPAMLTLSTARYLCQPDWTVDEKQRFDCDGWQPQFDLKRGLKNTIEWYKKNQLL